MNLIVTFRLLVTILFFTASPSFAPEIGFYRVEKITGAILVRNPFESGWKSPKKGDQLVEGSLIQMEAGSLIKVRGIAVSGRIPKGIQLSTKEPIVTRLSEESLRRLSLGGYFVPAPEGMEKPAADSGSGEQVEEEWTLARAWQQAISIFDDDLKTEEGIIQDTLSAKPPDTAPVQGNQDEVPLFQIKHPSMGATLIVGDLPTDVVILWEPIDKKSREYRVLLWQEKAEPNTPVAITTSERHIAKIKSEGRYYLKVEATDGSHRTETYSFSVVTIQ